MTGKARLIVAVLALFAALCGGAWFAYYSSQPQQLTLRFHPFVGEEALQLNQVLYANPGGNGSFKVRDFQFFLSNVRLIAESSEFLEPESYHLVRFDNDDGFHDIVIDSVPRASYRRIEFGIGVDSAANGSITPSGDLDANGRMAWSWDVGYKFVLLEGGLVVGDIQYPLVYHIGFDENYKKISIDLDESVSAGHGATVEFRTDLLRMLSGVKTVDMAAMPSVKFDHTDARLLANNYAHMVSLCSENGSSASTSCGPAPAARSTAPAAH